MMKIKSDPTLLAEVRKYGKLPAIAKEINYAV